jgi:glycosyltransferase involved in cell wall biosynthesis
LQIRKNLPVKISLLIPDFSSNCLIRSYPIAEVLQRHYEIELIGPQFGEKFFAPYETAFPVKSVGAGRLRFGWGKVAAELDRSITGDVLYAFKPLAASLGIALRHRKRTGKPIVLDVEDHDLMLPLLGTPVGTLRQLLLGWLKVDGFYDRLRMHLRRGAVSDVIVVSTFLQKRYGGVILYHGVDMNVYDPSGSDRGEIRREMKIPEGDRLILFAGTALPHKGVEEILDAVLHLGIPDLKVLLVGGSPNRAYYEGLLAQGGDSLIALGYQPNELMPKLLACADYVVLPQRKEIRAEAQIPAKIYGAMAMEKGVIGTEVSDIPHLLANGAGVVIPPGDQSSLEDVLRHLYEHPKETAAMGRRARERAEELFSYDAMEKTLLAVFQKYE